MRPVRPSNAGFPIKVRAYVKRFIAKERYERMQPEATIIDAMMEVWMTVGEKERKKAFDSARKRRERYDRQQQQQQKQAP